MNFMKLGLAVLIFFLVVGMTFFVRMNQEGYSEDFDGRESLEDIADESVNIEEGDADEFEGKEMREEEKKLSLREEMALHNTKDDCWVGYDGKVYDLTSFLPNHPGSAGAIIPFCGTAEEFEEQFTRQHGTSKVKMLMRVGVLIGDFDVMGEF